MEKSKTFDDELKALLKLLDTHSAVPDEWKDDFVRDITDWFEENAVYISRLDIGLHQEINRILDDGIITEEETDTLTAYIIDFLSTHKHFDYDTYKKDKQRITREDMKNITPYPIGDKDFIGKTVVITGAFSKFPIRKDAEIEIRRRGGKTSQSISNATNMFICGNCAGWAKLEQVKQRNEQGQNIRIVTEETFYKMLESNDAIDEE